MNKELNDKSVKNIPFSGKQADYEKCQRYF